MRKEYDFSNAIENPYGPWKNLPDRSVDNFARFRPGYPKEIIALLKEQFALASRHTLADIGSGTGNLSRLFLEAKHRVFGVEPSQNFRSTAEHLLSEYPNFTSIAGSAEETTLEDSSIDLITAGQALHWFNIPRSQQEFRRILKPKSPIVLTWNFAIPNSPYFFAYKQFLAKHGINSEPNNPDAEGIHQKLVQSFFTEGFSTHKFHHDHILDWDGFVGLNLSGREIPMPDQPGHAESIETLKSFFERLQRNSQISIPYEARVYVGYLS